MVDPRTPRTVYVGWGGAVWKSEDQGGRWRESQAGLPQTVGTFLVGADLMGYTHPERFNTR